MGGADEPELFGAPPREPDLVARLHLRHLLGHLQYGGGAVVVDPWALEDGVEMRPDHDDVVRIAAVGFSQDVVADGVLLDRLDVEEDSGRAGRGVRDHRIAELLGHAHHWDGCVVRTAERPGDGPRRVVDDHRRVGPSVAGVRRPIANVQRPRRMKAIVPAYD